MIVGTGFTAFLMETKGMWLCRGRWIPDMVKHDPQRGS